MFKTDSSSLIEMDNITRPTIFTNNSALAEQEKMKHPLIG